MAGGQAVSSPKDLHPRNGEYIQPQVKTPKLAGGVAGVVKLRDLLRIRVTRLIAECNVQFLCMSSSVAVAMLPALLQSLVKISSQLRRRSRRGFEHGLKARTTRG